ncbi:hypothetical protein BH24ACI5_BH24ACI5_05710 [soil metagenome]
MNLRCYALEAKYEFLKHIRMPAYAIPSIAFPVMFYLLFGTVATYLLATYGTFGVIGAALFGFGVGIAVERGQGWMTLKRATPMPPMAYFLAKVGMAVLFGAIIIVILAQCTSGGPSRHPRVPRRRRRAGARQRPGGARRRRRDA